MRFAVLLTTLLAIACGSAPSNQEVEQLDVTVAIAPDGSAQVQERFVVDLGPNAVGEFRWRSPAWKHDGVSEIAASMDGAAFRQGDGVGHVQIGGARDLDVRWMFTPTTNAHVFGLTYRAANVVHLSGIRGTVSWRALWPNQRSNVAATRITITAPESTVLLQDPWVDEAGWTVTRLPNGLGASRANVPVGESATAGLEFTVDRIHASRPQWQTDHERAVQFVPAFISAALFILVIAVGVIWMMWMKYPSRMSTAAEKTPRNIGTARVLWRATRRKGAALVDDLASEGLVDRERVTAARDLWRAGIAVIVLGVFSELFTRWAIVQYGAWPLVIPWSIVVAGIVFLVGAARFPVLTETGARERVLYCARISDGRTSE